MTGRGRQIGQKFTVEQQKSGAGYVVLDPNGVRVGTVYRNFKDAALARDGRQRRHDRAAGMKERACMCCLATFQSEGIHNRLCNPCRGKSSANEAGFGPSLRTARAGHR